MAETTTGITADTSSYKLPTTSPFDVAKNIGGLQQQKLAIDQAKMDQANQALTYLTRAMAANGPNASPEQYLRAGQDAVNAGLVQPNMFHIWENKVKDYASRGDMPGLYNEFMTAAANHQFSQGIHVGPTEAADTGQGQRYFQMPQGVGARPRDVGSIQRQIPVTAPVLGPQNQQQMYGPEGVSPTQPAGSLRSRIAPPLPPGQMSPAMAPGMRPGERATNVQVMPPTSPANAPGTSAPPTPRGPVTGLPPDYEVGLKQFAQDQELATQKLTAIKPALQALPLAQDLTTGIGTETYNKVLAAAHNLGILPQGMTNKVALYQEINKKMADYVRSNPVGQRSDAAQALSEAASQSPKAQINPALVKLTQDAIALDRVQAIRSLGFTDAKGNQRIDYTNYGKHRSEFPARIDERALKIDIMKPDERKKLLDDMEKKQNSFEGKKFKYTLELADKIGLFDMNR